MATTGSIADKSAALSIIKAQQAAQTGVAISSIDDTAAQTYAQGRLATLSAFLTPSSFNAANPTTAFVTSQLTAALATLDANFTYVLPTTSAVYANLTTGSQWTRASSPPASTAAPSPAASRRPLASCRSTSTAAR